MQEILFNHSSGFPARGGGVSSTARKGDKWFNNASVGDVLLGLITESHMAIGRFAVVAKERVTYADVIANADHNYAAKGGDNNAQVLTGAAAGSRLASDLEAAYGTLLDSDVFTILHLLPLND